MPKSRGTEIEEQTIKMSHTGTSLPRVRRLLAFGVQFDSLTRNQMI